MLTASTGTCFASFACHDVIWILSTVWLEQLSISMHGSEKALVLKEKFMTEVSSHPSLSHHLQQLGPSSFGSDRVCYTGTDSLSSLLSNCPISLSPSLPRYPATHHSAHTTSTTYPKKRSGNGRWKSLGVWYIM